MGRSPILDKLNKKLSTSIISESDAVYILSRVRKILEIDNAKDKYSVLNFYCNLSLHSNIKHVPKSISDMLTKIKDGTDYHNSIIGFEDFHKEFKKFLKENDLPECIYTETYGIKNFNKLLLDIYSDTPITLESSEKYQVVLDLNGMISFLPSNI